MQASHKTNTLVFFSITLHTNKIVISFRDESVTNCSDQSIIIIIVWLVSIYQFQEPANFHHHQSGSNSPAATSSYGTVDVDKVALNSRSGAEFMWINEGIYVYNQFELYFAQEELWSESIEPFLGN